MKKRIIYILTAVFMFAVIFHISSAAAEAVSFVAEGGKLCVCDSYTVINADNMPETLETGWYIVQGEVDYTFGGELDKGITVSGNVTLILADGCSLTVKGEYQKAGISVGEGNSLTVYSQTQGTGKLSATGAMYAAGIGGSYNCDSGYITITGGNIKAVGTDGGAGIGGGKSGSGKNITIKGGNVTATGKYGGAGIGGGDEGSCDNITISGGYIYANATEEGVDAIGAGKNGTSYHVYLCGGYYVSCPNILNIPSEFKLTDSGNEDYPFKISCVSHTLATPSYIWADDGSSCTASGVCTVCGDIITESATITSEVKIPATTASMGTTAYTAEFVNSSFASQTKEITDRPILVPYIKADGTTGYCEDYTVINAFVLSIPKTWQTGWYVIEGTISSTISGICVSGDVHIILTDGCSVDIAAPSSEAGITVVGEGNSLTIYGQELGTGTLKATGGSGGAGIGGGSGASGNNITINGGNITAKSVLDGAGIGGGLLGSADNITINGGNITATGGTGGAGIGGGYNGSANNITINGGTINAKGGDCGAGIGGGLSGSADNITISGGNITANGGLWGAGIGGGSGASGNNITISGGYIKAVGNIADNIGAGKNGTFSAVVLKGGYYADKPNEDIISAGYYISDSGNADFPYVLMFNNTYVTSDGTKEICETFTEINAEHLPTVWNSGWYIVTGEADYTKYNTVILGQNVCNSITVSGDVHLILTDGCYLKVSSAESEEHAGIFVGEGSSLTIYGQEQGSGKLEATGGKYAAGIGGGNGPTTSIFDDNSKNSGNITINGGYITANGGLCGAGIGGGQNGNGSNITVNGGHINAYGGDSENGSSGSSSTIGIGIGIGAYYGISSGAAGIGGGEGGSGTYITVNGGYINAVGGSDALDIGGALISNITLSGGYFARKPTETYLSARHEIADSGNSDYPYIIVHIINTDCNGDGKTNISDAVYMLWAILDPSKCSLDSYNHDFNGDGKTNIQDAVYLLWNIFYPEEYLINNY